MTKLKNVAMGGLVMVVVLGLLAIALPEAQGQDDDYYVYLPVVMKSPPILTIPPVALTCGSNEWTVAWDGGDEVVSEYVLEEGHDAAFSSATVYTTTETSLAFNHAPSVDNFYYYRVRADGSWGAGPWSNTIFVSGGFYDGFANPASGWATADNTTGTVGYQGGQYKIGVKQAGYLISAAAPDAARDGYTVEAEAQWAAGSATDGMYALVFGATASFDKYYFLAVRPDGQLFRLYFFDSSLPTADRLRGIMGWTASGVINSGAAMNKLQVTRIGSSIQVRINDTDLGTWSDGELTGPAYTGLMATSNPAHPMVEARFDNFEVGACDAAAVQQSQALRQPNMQLEGEYFINWADIDW